MSDRPASNRPVQAPVRTCLRPADWPDLDWRAWARAIAPRRGPFRCDGGGPARNPHTVRKVASGYGRWLGYLHREGQLDPTEAPAQRPTPERLNGFFAHLRACGNADYTVVARFDELRMALQWMVPDTSFRWITSPHGVSIRAGLPMQKRRSGLVPDAAVLLAWAEELFREGLTLPKAIGRRVQVREAVMIGILATRAPRLRACAALRTGIHLCRQDNGWILDQEPAITKTRKRQELPLSTEVAVMLDRYLGVERVELLAGGQSDALWISTLGTPLAEASLSRRTRIRSLKRFGTAFGPHLFRACLATTLALEGRHTLDASVLLGHTNPQTTLAAYNRALGHAAARRHGERLQRLQEAAARAVRAQTVQRDVATISEPMPRNSGR
jgi:site-specific recombinase XerC